MRPLALALLLLPALGAAQGRPVLEAGLRAFKPDCSSTDPETVREAALGASQLLEERCQLRLRWAGLETLPSRSGWCHLPPRHQERRQALNELAQAAKLARPAELALFLLPSSAASQRYSWALVDTSLQSACDSPQEPRFLPRFGSLFFTDLTWMATAGPRATTSTSRASLLLAHEALHALSHRAHPTDEPHGRLMADHVADMGPEIGEDWCACARRSPYLKEVR